MKTEGSVCTRSWFAGLTLALAMSVIAAQSAQAQTFTVLHNFTGQSDGAWPEASVIGDADGNLYGTTVIGGTSGSWGTVFKVDTSGTESLLYSFTGGADGGNPYCKLVRDVKGNLYGTTQVAGTSGEGTVYKLNGGTDIVLHSFTGSDGENSYLASLLRDAKGNLYGVTYEGGTSGDGTVYKLSKSGVLTVLHNFSGLDGNDPYGLFRDAKGTLYGTTVFGGSGTCTYFEFSGCGTVWKLTPPAATTTALTSSPNPSTYGQAVTFAAVVTSNAGVPSDGETVSFMKGNTVLGTGELGGGSTTFTTSALKVGTTAVKAVYVGDSNFAGSISTAEKQVVLKAGSVQTP